MDKILKKYRDGLIERYDVPNFADEAVHTAPILAVLQDPGNSGAEESNECSIDNDDPTARRQKAIIAEVGIDRTEIVFWNFFASYDTGKKFGVESQKKWGEKLEELIVLMPDLKVILVFGTAAWQGMRFVKLKEPINLIAAPHPSNRGISQPDAKDRLKRAWERAESIIH
jgi:hypothetical protein